MTKNDGGPAFPRPESSFNRSDSAQPGMSTRCWLVGHILEGMNASPELMQYLTKDTAPQYDATMAQAAIRQADAVIVELEKEEEDGNADG